MAPTVLVTGGAGYIGSHTCKALAAAGFLPVTFDDLSGGYEWAVQWGPLVRGDLLDRAAVERAVAEHRPVAALHFAARIEVGESVVDPGRFYRNNVLGSLNLLEALVAADVGAVVFSSTAAVYGNSVAAAPIAESHPLDPINPYGWSKRCVEQVLSDFEVAHGLRSVVLRYFNAAGADPDGEIGESHDPETHVIPILLQVASGDRDRFTIFGADYPTPDGTCIRDYVHVADLADAHVLAVERLLAGSASATFNLGNGGGNSVREVIDAARRVTGAPIVATESPRRPGDPPMLVASASRARSELGWQPRYADLDTIIGDAWRWCQSPVRRP